MDKSKNPSRGDQPERHYHRELPRFWITLPMPVRRRALQDPLLRGLFPTHVGYFARARGHAITREQGLTNTIFNYCVEGRGSVSSGAHARGQSR